MKLIFISLSIHVFSLSLLPAVLIGASQALYQVDVKREQKADVASVSPGWSRCSVIFSSGAFLLGAGLSLVDHVTRNRLQERTPTKKTEFLNKLVELNEKHKKAEAATPVVSQTSLEKISGSDKTHSMHDNQTPMPADVVMTTSSVTQRMEKRINANPEPKLLLVSELLRRNNETRATAAIQGTQPQNMEHNNELRATSRSRFHKEEKPSMFRGKEGMAAVADALRKHKMTNYGKVILSNGRQCLPSVEEETASASGNERRFLERQAALDVDDLNSSRTSDRPDTNSFSSKDYVSVIKARKVEPNSKHIIVTESRDLSEWNNQRQNTREILNKNTPEKYPQDQRKRGNSVVENAVASVSHFMDTTVRGGHVFAENYLDTSETGRCSLSEHSSLKCAHKPTWRRFVEESSKVRRNNRERFVVAERHVLQ